MVKDEIKDHVLDINILRGDEDAASLSCVNCVKLISLPRAQSLKHVRYVQNVLPVTKTQMTP